MHHTVKQHRRLSEKWIKASIAGTIWAASEIVLGSFLHNLRVPFSGNILTAIGLVILISISYIWRDKGLFWRAGLICAIMKTMSPSAVIFGPMIAIFTESVLLEISVTLLGRTLAGYALGAMLAMSWNLFHKIISYIVYYGPNIIEVYTNLVNMAAKQLRIQSDIVWLPIIILFIVYGLFGLIAAVIGIITGRRMLRQPVNNSEPLIAETEGFLKKSNMEFGYSIIWLFADILLLILCFLLLSYTEWYAWGPAVIIVAIIWGLRYRNALRRLSKPKFWVLFVIITFVTAFVFTRASAGEIKWTEGLITGIQMNFRAVLIILGFSVLGTELYNPVVRNFFSGTAFRNLPLAVELSVESLPYFISAIPDFKSVVRNPVSIFYNVISHAGRRLSEIKGNKQHIFFITGGKEKGKTSCLKKIVEMIKETGSEVGGIISERILDGQVTSGYYAVDALTGEKRLFLGTREGGAKIGKFFIDAGGLAFGRSILDKYRNARKVVVVIDEAGMLELNGGGWADNITTLADNNDIDLIIAVRDEYAGRVKSHWNIHDAVILDIEKTPCEEAAGIILEALSARRAE